MGTPTRPSTPTSWRAAPSAHSTFMTCPHSNGVCPKPAGCSHPQLKSAGHVCTKAECMHQHSRAVGWCPHAIQAPLRAYQALGEMKCWQLVTRDTLAPSTPFAIESPRQAMYKRCGYQARCREHKRRHLWACAHTAPAATTCQVQHSFISNPNSRSQLWPSHQPANGAHPTAHTSRGQTTPGYLPHGLQAGSQLGCNRNVPFCNTTIGQSLLQSATQRCAAARLWSVMVLAVCLHTCVLLQTPPRGLYTRAQLRTQRGPSTLFKGNICTRQCML